MSISKIKQFFGIGNEIENFIKDKILKLSYTISNKTMKEFYCLLAKNKGLDIDFYFEKYITKHSYEKLSRLLCFYFIYIHNISLNEVNIKQITIESFLKNKKSEPLFYSNQSIFIRRELLLLSF